MIDQNWTILTAALLAISEALSLIPAIKANGIIQAVFNIIRMFVGKR